MPEERDNSWNEWSRHVLKELERLDDDIKGLKNKVDELKEHLIELKVRVALIGAIAGLIVGAGISIIIKFVGK